MTQTMAVLATTRPLKFLGVTTRISTKSNPPRPFNIGKFADAEKFDNFDFFLNDEQLGMINGLATHDSVDVTFDLVNSSGRPSVSIVSIKKSSVPVGSK